MSNQNKQQHAAIGYTPEQINQLQNLVFNLLNRWGGPGISECIETLYTLALASPDIELEASNMLEFYETKKDLQKFFETLHARFYLPKPSITPPALPTTN